MDNLQVLWDLLKSPDNLVVVANIGVGYWVKRMPWIDNKFLETIVFGFSVVVTPFFKQPPIYGLLWGIVYALVSFKVYDWVLKRIEEKFKMEEKPTVLIPVLAACLFLSGCATGPSGEHGKVDPSTIQSGAQLTSYGFTYWALNLSHGDAKDLADKKEILAEVRKYLVIARDQGQAGAAIASGLVSTVPPKAHWDEYVKTLKDVLAALYGVELKAALNGLISGIDAATLAFP